MPNLLILLAFSFIVGYCFLWNDEFKELSKQIYSSAGFYQNFRLLEDVDYFAPVAERQPLLHLWSLAIEEQFYIVFPLLCGLIWRFTRSVKAIGVLVVAVTVGSFAFCMGGSDQRFNFYFPLTRFWELGAGIALSYLENFKLWNPRYWALPSRNWLSVVALAMLLWAFIGFDHNTVFPGIASLIPVLGAVLLIASHEDAWVNRWLTSRVMVFVGLISYSLYLWHWPFLAFQRIIFPMAGEFGATFALGIAVVASTLIYRWVEGPCRRMGRRAVMILLCGLVLAVVGGQIGKRMAENHESARYLGTTMTKLQEWEAQKSLQDAGPWLEKGDVRVHGFSVNTEKESSVDVLLVGDSHAEQNLFRFRDLASKNNISFLSITRAGTFVGNEMVNEKSDVARQIMLEVRNLLMRDPPRCIVVAQIWGWYLKNSEDSVKDVERVMSSGGFDRTLDDWRHLVVSNPNTKFVFILDVPWDSGSYDIRNRIDRWGNDDEAFHKKIMQLQNVDFPEEMDWDEGNQRVIAKLGDVATIIDPTPWVCPKKKCNLFNYRDDDHLLQIYVEKHGVWLDQIFEGLEKNPSL